MSCLPYYPITIFFTPLDPSDPLLTLLKESNEIIAHRIGRVYSSLKELK